MDSLFTWGHHGWMFLYFVIDSKDQGADKVSQWKKNYRWNSVLLKSTICKFFYKVPHIHHPSRNIFADVKQTHLTDHQTFGSTLSLHSLYTKCIFGVCDISSSSLPWHAHINPALHSSCVSLPVTGPGCGKVLEIEKEKKWNETRRRRQTHGHRCTYQPKVALLHSDSNPPSKIISQP